MIRFRLHRHHAVTGPNGSEYCGSCFTVLALPLTRMSGWFKELAAAA